MFYERCFMFKEFSNFMVYVYLFLAMIFKIHRPKFQENSNHIENFQSSLSENLQISFKFYKFSYS